MESGEGLRGGAIGCPEGVDAELPFPLWGWGRGCCCTLRYSGWRFGGLAQVVDLTALAELMVVVLVEQVSSFLVHLLVH